MRTARVTWIIRVIQVFKFIGSVSVIKAKRVIITLNEYAKEREAQSEWQGRWDVCNLSGTSQGWTALIDAARGGHTACVEALVAAKAALDIQSVSYARLFACPVTMILCLYAHYDIIVICNPSLIISALGFRGDYFH
jgi:hypothetical protein